MHIQKNKQKLKADTLRLKLLDLELRLRQSGYKKIVGIDEAGRGPLAGPVVAAACCIEEGVFFEGVNDSKQLTLQQRESLYHDLTTHNKVYYGIGMIGPEIIDQINILQATMLAMQEALKQLSFIPDMVLVDGLNIPDVTVPCLQIVRGDSSCYAIAAASIIAKHSRDLWMIKLHEQFPQYGFDQHKGYGTPQHLEKLKSHGPCPAHRHSFEPLKNVKRIKDTE